MSELGQVLNPEAAKSIAEVPKEIEKWEEKVHRLKAKGDNNNITEDMMTAIVSRICPKRLRDYIELHCNIDDSKSYVQIKDEVLRVVESGVLGKGSHAKDDEEKGPRPMDVDRLMSANWEWQEDEHYSALNYMKGKGKGGKGPMNFGKGNFYYQYDTKGGYAKGKGKDAPKGTFTTKGYKGDGKGKGKGGGKPAFTTEFQGFCSYCGDWGHTQRYCAKRDRDWKGTNNLEQQEEAEQNNQDTNEANETTETNHYGDLGGLGLYTCMGTRTWAPSSKIKCCNRFQALDNIEEQDEENDED